MNKFKFQSSARGVESLLCLLRVSVFGAATWHLGFSVRVHKKDTFGTNRTFFFFFLILGFFFSELYIYPYECLNCTWSTAE